MATRLVNFSGSQFVGRQVHADIEFVPLLETINELARNNGLKIFVTSSARQAGAPVGGAIVRPATRSNHMVGHAIDMNVQIGDRLYNSDDLGDFENLPNSIKAFINGIRAVPNLRWGGDFNPDPDPVHIDDGLNVRNRDEWDAKFSIIQANLRGDFEFSENGQFEVIARSGLRLRSGPGTEFDIISSLPFRSRVSTRNRRNGWVEVDVESDGFVDGWVLASFLRTI